LVRSLEGRKLSEVEALTAEAAAAAAGLAGDGAAAAPGGAVGLGVAALRAAGRHYRGEPPAPVADVDGDPLVCYCFGVSACQIREAVRTHGLTSVSQVTDRLSAGGGCGTCRPEIKQILGAAGAAAPPGAASGPPWIAERKK
ncbi:MAG: (2Fe-2S)-binding protein, partial [Planctomycetales bacterium]|nr:(2Fe-2S)-binding protein [Planctomycetales bacterium]